MVLNNQHHNPSFLKKVNCHMQRTIERYQCSKTMANFMDNTLFGGFASKDSNGQVYTRHWDTVMSKIHIWSGCAFNKNFLKMDRDVLNTSDIHEYDRCVFDMIFIILKVSCKNEGAMYLEPSDRQITNTLIRLLEVLSPTHLFSNSQHLLQTFSLTALKQKGERSDFYARTAGNHDDC